ncbi:MAG TPA: sulfurtransferase TusA family protein [Spirochaetes bacterium]|nr:sulfurtransferase TusA family protein [Spirochaetota bacterium]
MPLTADQVLDARGLNCPMPIIKAKKEMDKLSAGQVLEVKATDPGSAADFKGWSKQTGHSIEEENQITEDGKTVYQFFIKHK